MIENIVNIVDIKVYSKPQDIFKHLLNGDCRVILQSHKNKKLFDKLGCSVNNSFYNPIQGA